MPCRAALPVPVPARSRLTNDTPPASGRTMISSAERERSGPLRQTIPKKASACRRKPSSTPRAACRPLNASISVRTTENKDLPPLSPAANATSRERAANAIRHSPPTGRYRMAPVRSVTRTAVRSALTHHTPPRSPRFSEQETRFRANEENEPSPPPNKNTVGHILFRTRIRPGGRSPKKRPPSIHRPASPRRPGHPNGAPTRNGGRSCTKKTRTRIQRASPLSLRE